MTADQYYVRLFRSVHGKNRFMITTYRVPLIAVVSLSLVSCNGWNTSEFNEGKARAMLENIPVTLESEQVSLSSQQVECGVGADLCDARSHVSRAPAES